MRTLTRFRLVQLFVDPARFLHRPMHDHRAARARQATISIAATAGSGALRHLLNGDEGVFCPKNKAISRPADCSQSAAWRLRSQSVAPPHRTLFQRRDEIGGEAALGRQRLKRAQPRNAAAEQAAFGGDQAACALFRRSVGAKSSANRRCCRRGRIRSPSRAVQNSPENNVFFSPFNLTSAALLRPEQ